MFALVVTLSSFSSAFAATYNANPTNYRDILSNLVEGDKLVLAAGVYERGLPITNLHGTSAQPIIISGPESGEPAVLAGNASRNTVQLNNSSYITLRQITLDGLNIPYIDAVNGRNITHHITIANLRIINHGFSQSTSGISTKGPAWDWIIRNNIIESAGTGMYLGNSDGNQPFVRGLIENNLIIDTIGYNIQIKHQNPRPTGIGMPESDSRTIIRHNVFTKANNASGGGSARPNLLVGHFPLSGTGENDHYEIYGNFFYQNPNEALFQGEGNIALYSNLFVNDYGAAINVQPHNDVPKSIHVFYNTIVSSERGISVTGGDIDYPQKVFANVVFAGSPIRSNDQIHNITDDYSAAINYLVAPTATVGTLNLFPLEGTTTAGVMDMDLIQGFTDSNLDFDGRPFRNTDHGAYVDDGVGATWLPQLQIKPINTTIELIFADSFDNGQNSSGVQITNTTPVSYQWSTLSNGSLVYIDRNYNYSSFPALYEGMDYLRTSNDDKNSTDSSFITFTVDRDVVVFVAHVNSATGTPAWMDGWVDTGDRITNTDRVLNVYSQNFVAGTVTLGGNGGFPSMYGVFISL